MIPADPLVIAVRRHNMHQNDPNLLDQIPGDRCQQKGTAILDIVGDIDAAADTQLNGAFDQARALNPARVLLNFAGVHYINSTGIAIIVALLAEARRDQLPVLVCNLSEHYQEIFRITRLSDFMRIFADEESALSADRAPS